MPPPKNEEDLDDLDDVLEEFNAPPPRPSVPPPVKSPFTSSSSVPSASTAESSTAGPSEDDVLSDEFAKQFAKEMEAMFQTLGGGEGAGGSRQGETEDAKKFREAWEKMIIDDLETDSKKAGTSGKEKQKEGPALPADDPFQKAVLQAMEKMQSSDEALKADEKNNMGDDTLEKLLSTLGDFNLEDGDGGGLESMLESMMSQLMSKEILYDPLKELHSKYPEYLEKNGPSLSTEERERYVEQSKRVEQIVTIFESPSYSDENPTTSAEILKLMNEMQGYGSPPKEIMGDMPPSFELGEDGLPKIPDNCIIS